MRIFSKHIIEGKTFDIIRLIRFLERELVVLIIDVDDIGASSILFLLIHGPDPDHNLDCFAHGKPNKNKRWQRQEVFSK